MTRRFKEIAITLALSVCMIGGITAPAYAATSCGAGDSSSKGQVLQGAGETGTDCNGTGISSIITAAVNILSLVVGIAAVVMIIIAGLRYTTSGGDSNRVSSAKSALIYAIVGLVIAVLAQFLVHFVISSANV